MILDLVALVQGYKILYTDCHSPSNVKTFAANTVCTPDPINEEKDLKKTFTVLQRPAVRKVNGYSCDVKISTYSFRCGAWGHLKLSSIPTVLRNQELTQNLCQHMVHNHMYPLPGNQAPLPLVVNEPVYADVNLRGEVKLVNDAVTCQGETVHIRGTIHANTVILAQHRVLIKEETYLVRDSAVEVESDHVSLDSCSYESRGCITGEKTYIWSLFDVPCNLQTIKNIRPKLTLKTYFIDHQEQLLLNTTGTTRLTGCPFSVTTTDHSNLFIAETTEIMSLPGVDPSEVEINLQTGVHLNYMSYQLERTLAQQSLDSQRMACQDQKVRRNGEATPLGDNQYGLVKADVYLVFTCEQKTAAIREEMTCYQDIPIVPEGFVNPDNRQYVAHSNVIPCSPTFPMTVKTLTGWIQITPTLRIRPEPLTMTSTGSTPFHLQDYSQGGLYSPQEIADWQFQLSFPNYEKAILKSITYGTCLGSGVCNAVPDVGSITPYSLDRLIPEIESKLNLWKTFKEFLHTYGDAMAFACLIIIGIKFLSDLVMISFTLLQAGPLAAVALISQLYFFHRSTYKRILKKHQDLNRRSQDHQELDPLRPASTNDKV